MFNLISKHQEERTFKIQCVVELVLMDFEVFGNVAKHCLECLMYLLI